MTTPPMSTPEPPAPTPSATTCGDSLPDGYWRCACGHMAYIPDYPGPSPCCFTLRPDRPALASRAGLCSSVSAGGYECDLTAGHDGPHRATFGEDEQGPIPDLEWSAIVPPASAPAATAEPEMTWQCANCHAVLPVSPIIAERGGPMRCTACDGKGTKHYDRRPAATAGTERCRIIRAAGVCNELTVAWVEWFADRTRQRLCAAHADHVQKAALGTVAWDGPPAAPTGEEAETLTETTQRDWRYHYLRASEATRVAAEVLSSDTDTALARVESCLDTLGHKGSAGAWLDNTSLLAMRRIVNALTAQATALAALRARVETKPGVYIASRSRHGERWKALRAQGVPVLSSWIDECEAGATDDWSNLWTRCVDEAASAEALIFYAPVEDAPWKGALVEVGAALSHGRPVFVVGDPDACSFSFVNHPRVTVCATLSAAIRAALAPRQTEERQP